jgi:predicted nucleic acid-binding protein
MAAVATDLFERAERGELELTTSEAVIAEVMFVLTSPNLYKLDADDAGARVHAILEQRGFQIAGKQRLLRALSIVETRPSLGFVDALVVAHCESGSLELATFDQKLGRFPGISRWQP